jgi:hypothetical protein
MRANVLINLTIGLLLLGLVVTDARPPTMGLPGARCDVVAAGVPARWGYHASSFILSPSHDGRLGAGCSSNATKRDSIAE